MSNSPSTGTFDSPLFCPHCATPNNGHTGMFGAEVPDDGSVSVCAYCGRPAIFVSNGPGHLSLRLPTDEESRELDEDPRLTALRFTLMAYHDRYGRSFGDSDPLPDPLPDPFPDLDS